MRAEVSQNGRGTDRLQVAVALEQDSVRVAMSGELDLATEAQLAHALTRVVAQAPARVVVDLSGLEFMDARGVAVLLHARERAHAIGSRIELVTGHGEPRRLLELCGVLTRLDAVPEAPD